MSSGLMGDLIQSIHALWMRSVQAYSLKIDFRSTTSKLVSPKQGTQPKK